MQSVLLGEFEGGRCALCAFAGLAAARRVPIGQPARSHDLGPVAVSINSHCKSMGFAADNLDDGQRAEPLANERPHRAAGFHRFGQNSIVMALSLCVPLDCFVEGLGSRREGRGWR